MPVSPPGTAPVPVRPPGTAPTPDLPPANPVPYPPPAPPIIAVPPPDATNDPVIIHVPGWVPGVAPQPRTHPRRPGPGVREKKIKVAGLFDLLFGAVTESMDFIGALYKALPWCLRPVGFVSPAKQAEALWKNWEYINWREGMANLVENQIEDRVIGMVGQATGSLANRAGYTRDAFGGQHLGLGNELDLSWASVPGNLTAEGVRNLMADYVPPPVPEGCAASKYREIRRRAAGS